MRDQASIAALSAFDVQLSIRSSSRQIFVVFQPVTDEHHRYKGNGILSRWNRNGSVLAAGDFTVNTLGMCLTGAHRVLSFRKRCRILIKAFRRVLFRRNIPPPYTGNEPASHDGNRASAASATGSQRLVLEFSEMPLLNGHGKIAENIVPAKARLPILLDDCFSKQRGVSVRTMRFSADWMWHHQRYAARSARAGADQKPIFYCQLTGSRCTEGVDTWRIKLQALGESTAFRVTTSRRR